MGSVQLEPAQRIEKKVACLSAHVLNTCSDARSRYFTYTSSHVFRSPFGFTALTADDTRLRTMPAIWRLLMEKIIPLDVTYVLGEFMRGLYESMGCRISLNAWSRVFTFRILIWFPARK